MGQRSAAIGNTAPAERAALTSTGDEGIMCVRVCVRYACEQVMHTCVCVCELMWGACVCAVCVSVRFGDGLHMQWTFCLDHAGRRGPGRIGSSEAQVQCFGSAASDKNCVELRVDGQEDREASMNLKRERVCVLCGMRECMKCVRACVVCVRVWCASVLASVRRVSTREHKTHTLRHTSQAPYSEAAPPL